MSNRAYYSASVKDFLITSSDEIIGIITSYHSQDLVHLQTNAWGKQIEIVQTSLQTLQTGYVFFEMLIPRMGKRADVVSPMALFLYWSLKLVKQNINLTI